MVFLKGHSAVKGMAGIRMEAKGPCVIRRGHCNQCCLRSLSSSGTFNFTLSPLTLSLSLLIITVTVLLIFILDIFILISEEVTDVLKLIRNSSFLLLNQTDLCVNFSGPHISMCN